MVISGVWRLFGFKVKTFEESKKNWKRLDKLGSMCKMEKKYTSYVHKHAPQLCAQQTESVKKYTS